MKTGIDFVAAITRGINDADAAAIDTIFTPDARSTQYRHAGGVLRGGLDAIRQALSFSISMFPNVRVEASDVTDAGDRLAFLLTASIPDLDHQGRPKPVALAPVFAQVRDGKVSEMTVFGRLIQPND